MSIMSFAQHNWPSTRNMRDSRLDFDDDEDFCRGSMKISWPVSPPLDGARLRVGALSEPETPMARNRLPPDATCWCRPLAVAVAVAVVAAACVPSLLPDALGAARLFGSKVELPVAIFSLLRKIFFLPSGAFE